MFKFGAKSYFLSVISILIITNLVILLDIPILRQIFGLVFLVFVPGFFLLSILKLNKLGLLDKIVLSVGLSFAFVMLLGLLINNLLLAIGYPRPLSTNSLLISFSTATIILTIIAYIRNKDVTFSFFNFKLTNSEKSFLIVPALFPLLSILGMRFMNLTNNNMLLMFLLILIPAYIIFISFSRHKVSERVYPTAIFLISISLLLMYSLRSNHVIAGDTHREYFIFMTTLDNFHWQQLGFANLDSCLSISLLPAVCQLFLNINPEYLFKLIFSVIGSILPLVVYLLSKKYVGSFYALLASVFFMSQIIFLQTPSFTRAVVAVVFFALAIWVLFNDNISEFSKRVLFIIFVVSTILSHYGVTYVTFFVLLSTWIGMKMLSSITSRKKELKTIPVRDVTAEESSSLPSQGSYHKNDSTVYEATALKPPQTTLGRRITITSIVIFLTMLFLWYSQMTGTSFAAGVRFIHESLVNWQWFLSEKGIELAGQGVQAAFGKTYAYTAIPQRIEFVFSWLTIIFIATGILTIIRRFKTMVSTPQAEHAKPDFLLKKFDAEYLTLSIACCILLVATVMIPFVSKYYSGARVYFQMMVPLSVFFIIGGITVAKYVKARPYWVILVVLIPYFLTTTSTMHQLFGFPRAITLNSRGPLYTTYISDEDSYAAKWIKGHVDEELTIFVTGFNRTLLLSHGKIPYSQTDRYLVKRSEQGSEIDGYIYLRSFELGDDGLVAKYPDVFADKSKVYSNGGSEVYK